MNNIDDEYKHVIGLFLTDQERYEIARNKAAVLSHKQRLKSTATRGEKGLEDEKYVYSLPDKKGHQERYIVKNYNFYRRNGATWTDPYHTPPERVHLLGLRPDLDERHHKYVEEQEKSEKRTLKARMKHAYQLQQDVKLQFKQLQRNNLTKEAKVIGSSRRASQLGHTNLMQQTVDKKTIRIHNKPPIQMKNDKSAHLRNGSLWSDIRCTPQSRLRFVVSPQQIKKDAWAVMKITDRQVEQGEEEDKELLHRRRRAKMIRESFRKQRVANRQAQIRLGIRGRESKAQNNVSPELEDSVSMNNSPQLGQKGHCDAMASSWCNTEERSMKDPMNRIERPQSARPMTHQLPPEALERTQSARLVTHQLPPEALERPQSARSMTHQLPPEALERTQSARLVTHQLPPEALERPQSARSMTHQLPPKAPKAAKGSRAINDDRPKTSSTRGRTIQRGSCSVRRWSASRLSELSTPVDRSHWFRKSQHLQSPNLIHKVTIRSSDYDGLLHCSSTPMVQEHLMHFADPSLLSKRQPESVARSCWMSTSGSGQSPCSRVSQAANSGEEAGELDECVDLQKEYLGCDTSSPSVQMNSGLDFPLESNPHNNQNKPVGVVSWTGSCAVSEQRSFFDHDDDGYTMTATQKEVHLELDEFDNRLEQLHKANTQKSGGTPRPMFYMKCVRQGKCTNYSI